MAARKKRLKKLVDAVSSLLGDQQKARKLKKSEALERFIAKLEAAHRKMEKEKPLKGKAAKEQQRRVESLAKQIKKAKRILAEMN